MAQQSVRVTDQTLGDRRRVVAAVGRQPPRDPMRRTRQETAGVREDELDVGIAAVAPTRTRLMAALVVSSRKSAASLGVPLITAGCGRGHTRESCVKTRYGELRGSLAQ